MQSTKEILMVPAIFNGYLIQIRTLRPDLSSQLAEAAAAYSASHTMEEFHSLMRQMEKWRLTKAKGCVLPRSLEARLMARARTSLGAGNNHEPWHQLGQYALSELKRVQNQKVEHPAVSMVVAMAMAFVVDLCFARVIAQKGNTSLDSAGLSSISGAIAKHTGDGVYFWATLVAGKNGKATHIARCFAYEQLAVEALQRLGATVSVASDLQRIN